MLPIIWQEWHSVLASVPSLVDKVPEFAMKRQRVQMPTAACVTKLAPLLARKSQSVHDPEEPYIILKAPPFVAPRSTRLLASSLPTLFATSKMPPLLPALIVQLFPTLPEQAPIICTVVLSIAGNSQSPKELSMPWKLQSDVGMSPLEQSSYLIGREARLISEVIVMTNVTPAICIKQKNGNERSGIIIIFSNGTRVYDGKESAVSFA